MARKKISQLPLDNAVIGTDVLPIVSDGATKRVQLSTLGTYFATVIGGGQPSAHATTHGVSGSDPVTVAVSQVTGLQTALDGKQATGSYATLVGGKVPAEQLPSYVDDIIEAANFAALPGTGAAGLLYVTLSDNKVFRWSGSTYVEVAASGGVSSWNDLTDRPTEFPPEAHAASHGPNGADELYDQSLSTTDTPSFASLSLYASAAISEFNTGPSLLIHSGDGQSYRLMQFGVQYVDETPYGVIRAYGNNGDVPGVRIESDAGLTALWCKSVAFDDSTVQTTAWTGTLSYTALSDLPTLFDGDYGSLTNTPTLGTAAAEDATAFAAASHQHSYADITDPPDLSVYATASSLATVATSGAYADLSGLPTLGTAAAEDATAFAPSAHKTSHATGGSDALTAADIGAAAASHTHTLSAVTDAGTAASRNVPATGNAGSTEVVLGSDTRLTDARTPASHSHGSITNDGRIGTTSGRIVVTTTGGALTTATTIGASQVLIEDADSSPIFSEGDTVGSALKWVGDWVESTFPLKLGTTADRIVVTGTGGVLTTAATISSASVSGLGGAAALNVGTTAGTVAAGDDARLSDARTPTAHSHAASEITSGVIATARLASSGTASSTTFLRGDQTWATVQSGSSSASDLTTGTLAYARMADPTVTSPSQITASQNDYTGFARGINRFSTNAARDITGMAAGADGEVRVLTNVGTTAANTLIIKDESSSSTAANRFSVPWNGDCVIPAEGSVVVFYDNTSQRWRVV